MIDAQRGCPDETTPPRRTSCRCSTSTPPISSAALELAAQVKADRSLGRQAPTARCARRPARRDAVRQAVAAHAHDVRDRRPRAGRPRRRAAARRRPRPPRAGRRRGAQSRALGRRGRHPHLLAATCSRSSPRAAPRLHVINALTDQRASLPGARRLPDAAGAVGAAARPDASRTSATATTSRRRSRTRPRCSASTCTSPARRAISCRIASSSRRPASPRHGARLRLFTDAADAVAGADAVYTDTWTSMGQEAEAESARAGLRAVSGERRR